MRFYKLNGVWQSWDYLHNELGYAEHATRPTVFKSCADATWGEAAGNGYYDGDVSDMINGTFWTDADPTGWFDLDGLVWNSETYPADAAPSLLVKDGVASDALVITCDDGNYYLIRAIIDTTAWIPESEVEALGWRSPSFVVVDSTTGKIVSGCNQELTTYELPSVVLNSEDGYETYELPSISLAVPKMVIGVPTSGPVQAFWFTENGQAETVDTELVIRNGLRDADGVKVKSVDNTDYQGANVLAYMEADGDMFTSSEASFTWFGSDSLRQLFVSNQDARGKSAWSVFAAKLFHLSFVNTQLPDVTIELPAAVVDTYRTSVTLPTIDGEYESGGKTWKPSAWDIGAFGSSYTLNADTVAHLVFTEVVQYQEITLYMQSGSKQAQMNVNSTFVGDVDSTYCYQLYTDPECTMPWTGYDYSNDYEVGRYVDGEWDRRVDLISSMPASDTPFTFARILMDTGRIWYCCNDIGSAASTSETSIVVRIYPKGQQHYAFYSNSTSLYNNTSLSNGNVDGLKGVRGISSAKTVAWRVQDSTLPVRTIVNVLGSAGNELSLTGLHWRDITQGYNYYQLANGSGGTISYRSVIFTLSKPTLYGWLNSDKTDKSISQGATSQIYDASGNAVQYDAGFTYRVIGIFKSNGDASTDIWASVSGNILEQASGSNGLQFYRNYSGTLTISKVWYIKEVINPIETTFGAAVTIPAGYEVESVTCSRGYAFATNVVSSGTIVDYEIPGEKVYFDDTNTALVGVNVKPALQISVINNLSQGVSAVLSSNSGYSGTKPATASASYVNSGGYTVKGSANFSNSGVGPSVAVNMQTFPVYFNLSDSSGNWLYFCFRVPQTLWQFQNGTFSWLGDTTDSSDLAYWYNTRAVRINLRPITT